MWKTLAEEMLVAGEGSEPCPAPRHSPRRAGAGLSADTSSAPLLGFYLWEQGDQWATETGDRDEGSNSLATLGMAERRVVSQT